MYISGSDTGVPARQESLARVKCFIVLSPFLPSKEKGLPSKYLARSVLFNFLERLIHAARLYY